MAEQILIIGLGQFGVSLAKTLSDKGAEVIAVDTKPHKVEEVAEYVSEALVLNAAEENELARLSPSTRDIVVCAIGDESKEASIICTALLRQMGAPLIIARASDAMHHRILQLVGAHQVINPEEEFGKRFASRLLYRDAIATPSLVGGGDLQLTEIKVQPSMVGKNLIDLALPKKYGIIVAAIRHNNAQTPVPPIPTELLQEDDTLIIVSNEPAITLLMQDVDE